MKNGFGWGCAGGRIEHERKLCVCEESSIERLFVYYVVAMVAITEKKLRHRQKL